MRMAISESSARQRSGEPSPVRDRNGNQSDRPRSADIAEVERQIASLANRATQDLRVGWRQLHRTGPPPGLSRDLIIRGLVHELQERTYGGVSLAAPPAHPVRRVRQRRFVLRFQDRAEDRHHVGASVARPRPHRSRSRGRVRI